MNAPGSADAEFLARAAENRKVHLERLTGILEEYLKEMFADDRELLQEDMKKWIDRLQTEVEQKISGFHTYEELSTPAASRDIADLAREKTDEFQNMLREKKKVCVRLAVKLLLGTDAGFDYVEEAAEQADFEIHTLPAPDAADEKKLLELEEERTRLGKEIERIEKEKEEAEICFRELVRQNAELRTKMEEERPEIKYLTRKIRREGFFGFLLDLLGKGKTETIEDDSELLKWQERVEEVQREYDAKARESNDRIEALKESWREKEEAYDRLDTAKKQLEKRFLEQLKIAFLEKLEEFLHGEGGFADRAAAGIERDLNRNAEKIRERIWNAYRQRV